MATVRDETAEKFEEGELGDPFKIDYRLLPLAPAPSNKPATLWELFLLGWRRPVPWFALELEADLPRKRRGA